MWKSELALDKYWVTKGKYFILAIVVVLGMGITDAKLLFCHGFQSKEGTRKFQWEIINTGKFMTASKPPFRLIVVAPLLIYLT